MISLCVIFLQKFKKLRTVFAILYKANQLCRYDLSGFDIHILNFLSVKKECQLKLPYLSRVSQHVNYHIPLQRVYQRPIAHIAKVSGSFYNEQAWQIHLFKNQFMGKTEYLLISDYLPTEKYIVLGLI